MPYAAKVKGKNVVSSICVCILDQRSTFQFHPIPQNQLAQPIFWNWHDKIKKTVVFVICKCQVTYGWLGINDIDSVV